MSAAVGRRIWPSGLLLLLPLWAGCATGAPSGSPAARASVRAALHQLVNVADLAGGRIGVVVADAATGEVLAEHDSERGFATASNMKLLSCAVALHTLGPDFRARTELLARGEVRDGVLLGDLVLRGRGDGTFGEKGPFGGGPDAFVAALRAQGIRRISGRVIGDGSWLGAEQRGHGWQWDYLDDDYAAPFGGLCMAGNVVTVRVSPGGSEPVVQFGPVAAPAPSVTVTQGPAGSATKISSKRALGSEVIVVSGAIAGDAKEQVLQVAVHDPAAFAAAAFAQMLRDAGMAVGGEVLAATGEERVLATHVSPPLSVVVAPLLTNSNNLYAEQVWRLAAREATGAGDTTSAEKHSKAFFRGIGVEPAGMVLADGSGLSRRNLVQPRQIAGLLLHMQTSPHREVFTAALPLAGRTGTLRNRFKDGKARDHVRAKTGYISRVVCLSGYLQRPEPGAAPWVFCVMLNDFTCGDDQAKAAVDAFVERLAASAGW